MVAQRPLTWQVREVLRARILEGRLAPGSQLPAEVELARSLGVSRTSLREAVLQLEQDGLLLRRHGYGTFVRSTHLLHGSLNINLSATELIRAHGMEPRTQDVGLQRAEASSHEADRLGLALGAPVLVLERVRTADGRPVVFTRDVIPAALFEAASVDPQELLSYGRSLYRFLAERLGRSVVDGIARINPEVVSPAMAARLKVPAGTPMLMLEQVDSDASGERVLLSWDHFVAEVFEFVVHRRGPKLAVGARPSPSQDAPGSDPSEAMWQSARADRKPGSPNERVASSEAADTD
jgi:DNA-binding GntR family transcriptional regulator